MARPRIMIVKGDQAIAKYLKKELIRYGYEVSSMVSSGEAAVVKATADKPDLILMDVQLRGEIDGIKTAELLRQHHPVPVIYLTGFDDEITLKRAIATEPFGYLVKPVAESSLFASIEIALRRHDLEQRMRQNEKWVSAALDSLSEAVFACDADGSILLMNHVAEFMTGRTQKDFSWQPLGAVLRIRDEESGRGIEDLVKAAMLSRDEVRSADRQYILISEHGTKTPIEFTISPIIDDSGRLLGAVLSVRDVTETNHFQEVLIRAKKEWERSMDSISLLVALVDKQRRIMRLNQAMASSLGVMPREAIGMSLSEIFRTAEMAEGGCPHANCMADHKEHSAVFFSSKLGSKVVMTAAPYYAVSGQLIGSVHVVQPIAEPEALQKADRLIGNRPSQLGEVLGSFFAEQTKDLTSARIELKRCSEKLETTSEALRILIQAVEGHQRDLANRAVSDLTVRVRPFLAQLRAQKLPQRSTELVVALDNLLSSHHLHLSHKFSKISLQLTPHEIQICELIHSGAGSKQIAEILGVTVDAVSKQRTRIRKKLGLNHSGQGLASWLQGGSEKDSSDKGLSPASVVENTYDEKNSEPQ